MARKQHGKKTSRAAGRTRFGAASGARSNTRSGKGEATQSSAQSMSRARQQKKSRPERRHDRAVDQGGNPSWLFGLHAVAEAWVNPQRKIRRLVVSDSGLRAMDASLRLAHERGLDRPEPEIWDKRDIDTMLPGMVHQGIALDAVPLDAPDIVEALAAQANNENAIFVLLDQVSDPHNIGAILRSCAAFGAAGLVVQDRVTPEVTGTLAKSACGAVEHVPIIRETNLARTMRQMKDAGYWCIGLDERGESTLAEAPANGRVVLVLGAEGPGLRRLTAENCDMLLRLPTSGAIGSLNVSNAAAVALYELVRAR